MRTVRVLALSAATIGLVYAIGCQPNPSASNTSPSPAASTTTTTGNTNPKVPASHKYYAQSDTTCVVCHTNVDPTTGNAVRFMPYPDSHTGRSQSGCLSCHTKEAEKAPPAIDMTVARVGSAPDLDPATNDTVWGSATEVSIPMQGGVNASETNMKFKAVHDGTYVYFRAVIADPTESLERQPLVKQADGTWKKTKAWPDKYEDKLSIIWNNPSKPIANFDTQGCAVTCHAVTPSWAGRPLMYTKNAGEYGDMWHAKTARHAAVPEIKQIDDQFIWHPSDVEDSTASAGTIKDGGRSGDGQATGTTSGDYTTNDIGTDGLPKWMPGPDGNTNVKAGNGNPFWMTATQSFDNTKFAVGDKVAAHLAKKLTGSRGNMDGYAKWSGGNWTYEWRRPLTPTDTDKDTVFAPGQTYSMGAAYFDNNQIGHSVQFGVTRVKFAQ